MHATLTIRRGKFTARRLAAVFAVMISVAATQFAAAAETLRVATFNLSLYGEKADEILARLQTNSDSQAQNLAEIIQRVRPDVILLNEIDYDPKGAVLKAFCDNYLAVPQHASQAPAGPTEAIDYPHRYVAAVNTGRHSRFDLGRNGTVDATPGTDAYGADAWGYGRYEGQYGMAILSRYPIDEAAIRTFQNFRWRDMPEAQLPDDPATPEPDDWYSAEILEQFPLSSKSHWDVPIVVDGRTIHLLASHPTPPTFDGPEDRNGRRNHDEIRFWVDYIGPAEQGAYIVDDKDVKGGLKQSSSEPGRPAPDASFIILGDLNGDPHDGDGPAGISALLDASQVLSIRPPRRSAPLNKPNCRGAPTPGIAAIPLTTPATPPTRRVPAIFASIMCYRRLTCGSPRRASFGQRQATRCSNLSASIRSPDPTIDSSGPTSKYRRMRSRQSRSKDLPVLGFRHREATIRSPLRGKSAENSFCVLLPFP